MRSILWHLGKCAQLGALTLGPYALYIGMSTRDAKIELKLLIISVILFIVGYVLVRTSSEA